MLRIWNVSWSCFRILACCYCLDTRFCPTHLQPHELQPIRLCPWDFPSKNTEVGCHFLFQGIFPTQGSKLHLLLLRRHAQSLSHVWLSATHELQPAKLLDRTCISCISSISCTGRQILYHWATWEAPILFTTIHLKTKQNKTKTHKKFFTEEAP